MIDLVTHVQTDHGGAVEMPHREPVDAVDLGLSAFQGDNTDDLRRASVGDKLVDLMALQQQSFEGRCR